MVASRATAARCFPSTGRICNMNLCYNQPWLDRRSAPSPTGVGPAPVGCTIDELARAAGTTTRQVRALQTQGLLPHPDLVGRTGYYDADHLDRLRAILRLQADGLLARLAWRRCCGRGRRT